MQLARQPVTNAAAARLAAATFLCIHKSPCHTTRHLISQTHSQLPSCVPPHAHKHNPHLPGRNLTCAAAAAGAASGPGDGPAVPPKSSVAARVLQSLQSLLQAHFLPLALLSAVLLGVSFPSLGLAAAQLQIPMFTTFGIFIIQGLQLRRKEAAAALDATGAISYGLLSILLITPLVGLMAVKLPLQPAALALGLGVFCTMPTALSSGITFTQQLGGNVSLALLLTVTSNILGIFTMPFILPHVVAAAAAADPLAAVSGPAGLTGSSSGAVLEPLPLLLQLCQTILLPTLIGASIRGFVPGVAGAVDRNKRLMSYLSAALLALVPWMQISKTASQNVSVEPLAIAGTALAGLAIHAVFLTINTTACWLLRLGGSDPAASRDVRRAVILVSSVKTLPVAVTVLGKLSPLLGEAAVGLAVLPCVLAHLGQILWDSVMVSMMAAEDRRREEEEEEEVEQRRRAVDDGGSKQE